MKATFHSALLAAAALATALPTLAQPANPPPAAGQGPRGPAVIFDQMDANKDDRVTWDEAWGFVQRRFAAADADRDGGLTRQEADALRPMGGRRAEGAGGGQQPAPSPEQAARRARFGHEMYLSK